jgi:hypothetical protein
MTPLYLPKLVFPKFDPLTMTGTVLGIRDILVRIPKELNLCGRVSWILTWSMNSATGFQHISYTHYLVKSCKLIPFCSINMLHPMQMLQPSVFNPSNPPTQFSKQICVLMKRKLARAKFRFVMQPLQNSASCSSTVLFYFIGGMGAAGHRDQAVSFIPGFLLPG